MAFVIVTGVNCVIGLLGVQIDITDQSSVDSFARRIRVPIGRLINNASVSW